MHRHFCPLSHHRSAHMSGSRRQQPQPAGGHHGAGHCVVLWQRRRRFLREVRRANCPSRRLVQSIAANVVTRIAIAAGCCRAPAAWDSSTALTHQASPRSLRRRSGTSTARGAHIQMHHSCPAHHRTVLSHPADSANGPCTLLSLQITPMQAR